MGTTTVQEKIFRRGPAVMEPRLPQQLRRGKPLTGGTVSSAGGHSRGIRAVGNTVEVMDFKLELVGVPVSDVDRAKAFYVDQAGFVLDHDHTVSDDIRFVQLTPPGSACSIAIGQGLDRSFRPELWTTSRSS